MTGLRSGGESPVVAAARGLAPRAAEAAEAIDSGGRLPPELVDALTAAGLNHLYLPASATGPEVDPLDALEAMEILARADASVAWCAHVSSANAWQMATLSPGAVTAMAGADGAPARRFSGSNRPCGVARPVDGGFVVSGRWDFASNCLHADWYCGTCVMDDGDRRRTRALFMPISAGTIVPTWQVAGLRGTGSHDFAVDDLFVPTERASAGRHLRAQPGPLFHPRLPLVANWALTAGVALGIARGALDAFTELAAQGTAGAGTPLRERAAVQLAVGRAEASLGAARAYCHSSIGAAWAAAEGAGDPAGDGGPSPMDQLVPSARLAIVHALHASVEVVDLLFHAGGTRSIFQCHGLERRFRDAHVALQHGAGSMSHYEVGGRLALGLPADAPFW